MIRMGVLGAARITPFALLAPARQVADVDVVAVAARDRKRAERFAGKHGIAKVHASYAELIADPAIDAVYNPLPNSRHHEWTLAALAAGKHVLCEKPLTANAREAEEIEAATRGSDRVVMEAFHYRYHPLAARMREVVAGGRLGTLRHVETVMCIPLPVPGNIRYRYDLAGGATMDVGCYAIHVLRLLAGAEPTVVRAEAKLASPDVDRWMRAEFELPGGATGRMTCALLSSTLLRIEARAVGDRGELDVLNPIAPQYYHRYRLRTPQGTERERFPRKATYTCQLEAFADAVLRGRPVLTPPSDSVANMRVIDAIYRKAGLSPRGAPS